MATVWSLLCICSLNIVNYFKVDTGHVYLLMNRDCCVSCNIRASWFFRHNNKTVAPHSAETDTGFEDGIKVISAILRDDSYESDEDLSGPRVVYRILPTTTLTFRSQSYCFLSVISALQPSLWMKKNLMC